MSEVPSDYQPPVIGSRAELIAKFQNVLPTANFADPSWGRVDGDGWSIEISVAQDVNVDGFALHVRGADGVIDAITNLLECAGVGAFDAQTGELFAAGPRALESLAKWRES